MKVFILAQYGPLAASSRTRVFQYLPYLARAGVSSHVEVAVPDRLQRGLHSGIGRLIYFLRAILRSFRVGAHCLTQAGRYDVLFLQKVLFPFPFGHLLKLRREKVVFDYDDAIFTTEAPDRDILSRMQAWRRQSALPRMLKASARVVVENDYTATYARRFGPEVTIITGPIDTERYRPSKRRMGGSVVLGWIGSRTTAEYLELIRGPLEELGRMHSNLSLLLVGAEGFDVSGLRVESRPWSLQTEVEDLGRTEIGLGPLPEDPWTLGKGGYKLLQYGSIGIPAVASPVGINEDILEDGVSGFFARTEGEWVESIDRLIRDPGLRRRMGEAARRKIESRYSLKEGSVHLVEAFERLGTS